MLGGLRQLLAGEDHIAIGGVAEDARGLSPCARDGCGVRFQRQGELFDFAVDEGVGDIGIPRVGEAHVDIGLQPGQAGFADVFQDGEGAILAAYRDVARCGELHVLPVGEEHRHVGFGAAFHQQALDADFIAHRVLLLHRPFRLGQTRAVIDVARFVAKPDIAVDQRVVVVAVAQRELGQHGVEALLEPGVALLGPDRDVILVVAQLGAEGQLIGKIELHRTEHGPAGFRIGAVVPELLGRVIRGSAIRRIRAEESETAAAVARGDLHVGRLGVVVVGTHQPAQSGALAAAEAELLGEVLEFVVIPGQKAEPRRLSEVSDVLGLPEGLVLRLLGFDIVEAGEGGEGHVVADFVIEAQAKPQAVASYAGEGEVIRLEAGALAAAAVLQQRGHVHLAAVIACSPVGRGVQRTASIPPADCHCCCLRRASGRLRMRRAAGRLEAVVQAGGQDADGVLPVVG